MGLITRFLTKIQIDNPDGCWIWIAAKRNEYGCMKIDGRTCYAHQVSYKLFTGELEPGLKLLHSCDNPLCVNPSHLTQNTQRENVLDAMRKQRITVPREPRQFIKSQLAAIRRDYKRGMSQRKLAAKHQLPLTTVRRVLGLIGK